MACAQGLPLTISPQPPLRPSFHPPSLPPSPLQRHLTSPLDAYLGQGGMLLLLLLLLLVEGWCCPPRVAAEGGPSLCLASCPLLLRCRWLGPFLACLCCGLWSLGSGFCCIRGWRRPWGVGGQSFTLASGPRSFPTRHGGREEQRGLLGILAFRFRQPLHPPSFDFLPLGRLSYTHALFH